jgi:CRISPR-associated protein Cmr3
MRIEPLDVWTFGDSRPFERGQDHHRATIFPPTPLTIQGAIRSKLLADSGVSFKAFKEHDASCAAIAAQIGWPDEKGWGQLRLRGPWLTSKDERMYPMPADVVMMEDKTLRRLGPTLDSPFRNNAPDGLQVLWLRDQGFPKEANGWLAQSEFVKYLEGQSSFVATPVSQLFSRESRFGVKIASANKRPEVGQLFASEYVRLANEVALQIEIDGVSLSASTGLLALGGGGRAARYTLDPNDLPPVEQVVLPRRFKIVFITPAYFEQGWRPASWDKWFSDARLIAAALRRPVSIGGRDVARNEPKSLWRFIPAGSVYFFESKTDLRYSGQMVTDFGAEIGFGQIATGEWTHV